MNQLFCKDCKHSFRKWTELPTWGSGAEWRCRLALVPETVEHDPVLGPKTQPAHYSRCSSVRLHEAAYKKNCGQEGLWWQPRHPRLLFLAIKHSERS